jgi:hypothetical protein
VKQKAYNKALLWTEIPLRSIAAGELGRYAEHSMTGDAVAVPF